MINVDRSLENLIVSVDVSSGAGSTDPSAISIRIRHDPSKKLPLGVRPVFGIFLHSRRP